MALSGEVRVLDAAGALVGIVPASLRRRERLTGPDLLEQVQLAPAYLLPDGSRESRWWMIEAGYQLLYEGGRYLIDVPETDYETGGSLTATSAEVELQNYDTNYSPGAATYLNKTPTQILDAVLAGKIGRMVRNPGFGILDSGGLPTNWTHPAGWTSALVASRRVWQADAGSDESVSDLRPCTPGISYRVAVDIKAPVGMAGTAGVLIRWRRTDGTTVDSAVTTVTPSGAFATVETTSIVALGNKLQVVLVTSSTDQVVQFDDVRLFEIGPDTGWTYAGSMDTRDALIPHTDGAIVTYGVWTRGATDLSASYAGDYLARVVNGPFVTVGFAAGGAGAQAKVRVNGVTQVAALDVSGATSYTVEGMDPANDHIVEVEVVAGTVKVTGFTVSTVNLISMRWDYKTVYEALASVQKAVGGELAFDTVGKVITHASTIGVDLRATNVVDFRRGHNLVRFHRRHDRVGIVNCLTGLGYGEGEYQLVVTVDATATNADGDTSQDLYGIRRGKVANKDWKDLATATAEVTRLVNDLCFGTFTYTTETLDATAALCSPGDVAHFLYGEEEISLRILEIARPNDGGPASLVVGDKPEALEDVVAGTRRELATLQRSYQGVPTDTNDTFFEQFERTAWGVDVPAECQFFVPYGADLLDLRARYQIGGMRAYARGLSAGGGQTSTSMSTPSGGGSTSGSGGATTLSQTAQTSGASSKTTADATTPSSMAQDVFSNLAPSRFGTASASWLTTIVPKWPQSGTTQWVAFTILNADSASHTFDYEVRENSTIGTLRSSGSIAIPAMASRVLQVGWTNYYNSDAYCRAQQQAGTANFAVCAAIVAYGSHGHGSHGHGMDHTHTVPSHSHDVANHTHTTPNHTHPPHSHDVVDHVHSLEYGIHESSLPATVRVYLDGALITALNNLTYVSDFDLLPYIGKDGNGRVQEGWHTLEFRTATAGATGSVRGTLFARKFLSVAD